jgi:hypothetical protein
VKPEPVRVTVFSPDTIREAVWQAMQSMQYHTLR